MRRARVRVRARSAHAAQEQREHVRKHAVNRARQLVALHGSRECCGPARQALAARLSSVSAQDSYAEEDDDDEVVTSRGRVKGESGLCDNGSTVQYKGAVGTARNTLSQGSAGPRADAGKLANRRRRCHPEGGCPCRAVAPPLAIREFTSSSGRALADPSTVRCSTTRAPTWCAGPRSARSTRSWCLHALLALATPSSQYVDRRAPLQATPTLHGAAIHAAPRLSYARHCRQLCQSLRALKSCVPRLRPGSRTVAG